MTTTRPLVSVVIPSYNHARFITQAIESVAAQSHHDVELIVVDDGSTDGSPGVVERALKTCGLHRSELVVQENRGAHAGINVGLAMARGEYCQILNSDDRLHPQRLEKLLCALGPSGELAFSSVRNIDAEGNAVWTGHPMETWYRSARRALLEQPTVGFGLLTINAAVSTSNFLFRRSLFERTGAFTPERLCHDWRFLLRALILSEPVWVDEALVDYRFHGDNTAPKVAAYRKVEGETALREYLAAACNSPPPNPLAPSPYWWPGFFKHFIDSRRSWFSGETIASFMPQLHELKELAI